MKLERMEARKNSKKHKNTSSQCKKRKLCADTKEQNIVYLQILTKLLMLQQNTTK